MSRRPRPVADPRALVTASLIVGVILLIFWAGYQFGKNLAEVENQRDAARQVGAN